MKSFIKAHKRNESIQSTTSSTTVKSPLSSPSLNNVPSSNSNSNSPKKLLVPIKNLFHKRRPLSELSDLLISKPIVFDENRITQNPVPSVSASNSLIVPTSKLSISSKRSSKFRYRPRPQENDDDDDYDDDDDDDDSSVGSNGSNFSFVKDTIGGRNTSVKYYKTKKAYTSKTTDPFIDDIDHDLDIDDDYDFDNNGLDDYDNDDDDINYIDNFEEFIPQNHDFDHWDDNKEIYEPSENPINYNEQNQNHYNVKPNDDKELIDNQADYDEFMFNVNSEEIDQINNSADFGSQMDSQGDILVIENSDCFAIHSKVPFNLSYHMSLDGLKGNENRSNDALDFLENYLETDHEKSNSSTPKFESHDDLELYDLDSPLINGITVGDGFTTRFKGISPSVHTVKMNNKVKSLHLSIDEINIFKSDFEDTVGLGLLPSMNQNSTSCLLTSEMENSTSKGDSDKLNSIASSESQAEINKTLKSLESGSGSSDLITTPSKSTTSSSSKINRQSINEMMNLLETLQTNDEISQQNKRDSIENMMSFLKNIQKTQIEQHVPSNGPATKTPPFPLQKKIKEELELELDDPDDKYINETTFYDKEADLNDLERDLIDEVNQLPEDFDFNGDQDLVEQFEALNKSFHSHSHSFTVSNSFKKKPKKMLPSPLRNNNIIETSSKTVTYYNHSRNPSTRKSHSPIEDLSTICEKS